MNSLISVFTRLLPRRPQAGRTENTAAPDSRGREIHDQEAPSGRTRDQSPPRVFPTSGFEVIDPWVKHEEEQWSWYSVKDFYPAAIGEVLKGRYQIITKLGYGTASTAWLCRDLRDHRYVTLKIYATRQVQSTHEIDALNHIQSVLTANPRIHPSVPAGIRVLLDQFEVSPPKSKRTNACLVFEPLGMSLGDVRKLVFDGKMPVHIVKSIAFNLLRTLDFLHRKANLVHADIQENNVLFAAKRAAKLKEVEELEATEPSPRKVYKDHAIYSSKLLNLEPTVPVLCDFGTARFGSESYGEEAMPDLYRAPEILLRIEWDEKIDIWALGLVLWTLVEGTNLFTNNKGGRWRSERPHMARMVSLLGPPPRYMLELSRRSKRFFDKNWRLKKGYEVVGTSLEAEATALEGEAKADFLRFLRRMLQMDPLLRPSARELLKDPWFVVRRETNLEVEEEEEEEEPQP